MFYLVMQSEVGPRLIACSDHSKDLFERIPKLLNENAASMPVVMDDKAMRAAILVDGFGIVAIESGDHLVPLEEL